MSARTLLRGLCVVLLAVGTGGSIVALFTNDSRLSDAAWTVVICAALWLLWSRTNEQNERLTELERRESTRFKTDTALVSRVAELTFSAWRIDPKYRDERTKREASEKYFRDLERDINEKRS